MNRIKELRVAAGIEQKTLALDLHVAQPTISEWESGKKMPSSRSSERLADYFGVSIDYLLGRDLVTDKAACTLSFSVRLKHLRERSELSRNDLAEALGITPNAVSAFENGNRAPTVEFIAKVATYFDVTTDYLLGISDREFHDDALSYFIDKVDSLFDYEPGEKLWSEKSDTPMSIAKLYLRAYRYGMGYPHSVSLLDTFLDLDNIFDALDEVFADHSHDISDPAYSDRERFVVANRFMEKVKDYPEIASHRVRKLIEWCRDEIVDNYGSVRNGYARSRDFVEEMTHSIDSESVPSVSEE